MALLKDLRDQFDGKKFSTYVKVPRTDFSFPITIVEGERPGPTVLIQAGLHNAEFVGIQAALNLIGLLEPSDISGTVIIIPLLNTSGFFNRTMSTVYEDGKNLNRVFPGRLEGSVSERIAHFLEHELYQNLDYFIDLHSGDCYESLKEFIYAQGNAEKDVREKSLMMAKATNLPFIVRSQSDTGGAYNYAGKIGVPAVLIERGCGGLWSESEVKADVDDVINILKKISVLRGSVEEYEDSMTR